MQVKAFLADPSAFVVETVADAGGSKGVAEETKEEEKKEEEPEEEEDEVGGGDPHPHLACPHPASACLCLASPGTLSNATSRCGACRTWASPCSTEAAADAFRAGTGGLCMGVLCLV